jgi:hypothetical protein
MERGEQLVPSQYSRRNLGESTECDALTLFKRPGRLGQASAPAPAVCVYLGEGDAAVLGVLQVVHGRRIKLGLADLPRTNSGLAVEDVDEHPGTQSAKELARQS